MNEDSSSDSLDITPLLLDTLACALSLALCFLAAGLEALLEKWKLMTVSITLPNAAGQASAEAMLVMGHGRACHWLASWVSSY